MLTSIPPIPLREALHGLGWRGQPVEEGILDSLQEMIDEVRKELRPRVIMHRFALLSSHRLENTVFTPMGCDMNKLLDNCDEAVLMAATLGAQSERMLIRRQAGSSTDALLMDAVLSAAIEAVCDAQETSLRTECEAHGLYLTDRFSPGYGDMPLEQTKEICSVLQTDKTIGLTVSKSGIMIPRKSVTAVMGISRMPQKHRPSRCMMCSMKETCALRECK
ncbi:MAG: methionine synthase [Clostridiales bacterium]|nr:methionine synthase [Clostridiales bacterium]